MSVETILKCSCATTGEGPHWDDVTQSLLYVDINNGIIHKWDSKTGEDLKHQFGIIGYFMFHHENIPI